MFVCWAFTILSIFVILLRSRFIRAHNEPISISSMVQGSGPCDFLVSRASESEIHDKNTNLHLKNAFNAAECFHTRNYFPEAMLLYQYITTYFPNFVAVRIHIAIIHYTQGNSRLAINELDVYFAEVGGIHGDQKPRSDYDSYKAFGPPCRGGAAHREECVNALNVYANAYTDLYNYTLALSCYDRALEVGDDVPSITYIHKNQGGLRYITGDYDEAEMCYLRAFLASIKYENAPDPSSLVGRAILVPSISPSLEHAFTFQRRFNDKIEEIRHLAKYGGGAWKDNSSELFKLMSLHGKTEDMKKIKPFQKSMTECSNNSQNTHFNLHYYGFHDRPTQELVAKMYYEICHDSLSYYNPSIATHRLYSSYIPQHFIEETHKIKVAFISCLFGGNEPHGQLMIDVIRRLPSKYFEVFALGIGSSSTPPSAAFLEAVRGNYHHVGNGQATAVKVLLSLDLDCIVYTENINNALSHFLGFQRIAPVQVLVMGAPVTSGMPEIDYFISGDRLEYPYRTYFSGDREYLEQYTEQVVLFDGQSISFPEKEYHPRQDSQLAAGDAQTTITASDNVSSTIDRDEYGIPVGNHSIYMLFQNLIKVHPVLDSIITKILYADKNGHVILQAARDAKKTQTVRNRIRSFTIQEYCRIETEECSIASNILSRIHFIKRVKSYQMRDVFKRGSVILHPFPFGGSKTSSDSLIAGTPLVTYPQKYLRGRMAANFYVTMAIHEVDPSISATSCCIANDISDYISKALRLGLDKEYRDKVMHAITARNYRLTDDAQTSFEWARFLTRAMGIVVDLDDLKQSMNYEAEVWQSDSFLEEEMNREQRRWKRSQLLYAVQHGLR